MISARIPSNEMQRLAELQRLEILDSRSERVFDRLTDMGARNFGVPTCVISLVDETREWFKSACGLEAKESPRHTAFCAHAILGREVFVVEDTHEDTRFRDNPLVTAKNGVRFYAGAPMITQADVRIGAFCVKDSRPRCFSVEDRWMLQQYAAMAVDIMEYRLVARAAYVAQCAAPR